MLDFTEHFLWNKQQNLFCSAAAEHGRCSVRAQGAGSPLRDEVLTQMSAMRFSNFHIKCRVKHGLRVLPLPAGSRQLSWEEAPGQLANCFRSTGHTGNGVLIAGEMAANAVVVQDITTEMFPFTSAFRENKLTPVRKQHPYFHSFQKARLLTFPILFPWCSQLNSILIPEPKPAALFFSNYAIRQRWAGLKRLGALITVHAFLFS